MTRPNPSTGAPCRLAVLSCLFLSMMVHSADAETRYFKVGEWPGQVKRGDSYVVPLTDPADIAHAEDLISQGPDVAGGTIVLAKIAAGSDGINRDFNRIGHPPWSWHVTEFVDFVDVTIEIYDGWPGMVENDMPFWMGNTGGWVGFWHYTVVEDVTAQVPEPSALALVAVCGLALRRRRRQAGRHSGAGGPFVQENRQRGASSGPGSSSLPG